MKTIFFNQRAMIICREGEQAEKDPEAVFIIDSGDDAILANAVRTIDSDTGIRKLYILCDNPELTYERLRKLFTEVDAAGGLVSNEFGQYLLIFRNGMWDLPKGKREEGESTAENAVREVMEECGIPTPALGRLFCVTEHTYHRDGQFVLKHTYWYAMRLSSGVSTRPQTEEGITRIVWVPAEKISGYAGQTYPSIKEVFENAGLL